jgi:hypothetical protein
MKTRLLIAPLALCGALLGCSKDSLTETPKSFLTLENYYKTPADIEAATFASYEPLTRDDVWRRWLLWDTEMASDMVRVHPDEPNYGTYVPGILRWTSSDAAAVNPWNGLYGAIYRANLVVERGPGVTFSDANYQKELVAEAKFIRAYSYLMLTKMYEDVPLLLTLTDHEAAATTARTPVEQVHTQVIKDLVDAEAALPGKPRALGRASKAAAQMVLADVYQWRSSFMKKSEWAQMSTYAKKVVDDANWGLVDDYLGQYLPANKGNKEIIWLIVSSGLDGRTSWDVNCNYLPRELGFNTAGGCEVVGQPTKWQYNNYLCTSPDTLKFDTQGKLTDTTRIAGCDYRKRVTYRSGGCSTNRSIGCITFKWPNINKYRATNQGVGGPIDVDFPYYRYAEALLMYAEAQNELGNGAVAIGYINRVRARARKGTGSGNLAEPHDYGTRAGELTDQRSVREAVYQERIWELAHEGKRWFDQVRRNSLEPGSWATSLKDHDFDARADFSEFRMRFPIPAREITLNSKLTQNTGY